MNHKEFTSVQSIKFNDIYDMENRLDVDLYDELFDLTIGENCQLKNINKKTDNINNYNHEKFIMCGIIVINYDNFEYNYFCTINAEYDYYDDIHYSELSFTLING